MTSNLRLGGGLTLLTSTVVVFNAAAQDPCSYCRDLLSKGVFRTEQRQITHASDDLFIKSLCWQDYGTVARLYQEGTQAGLDLGIPTETVGLPPLEVGAKFGNQMSEQQFSEWQKKYCAEESKSSSSSQLEQTLLSFADSNLVAGFNECMKICQGQVGVTCWNVPRDKKYVSLYIHYGPPPGEPLVAKVIERLVLPTGVSVAGRNSINAQFVFDTGQTLGIGTTAISLDRSGMQDAFLLSVRTTMGESDTYIPSVDSILKMKAPKPWAKTVKLSDDECDTRQVYYTDPTGKTHFGQNAWQQVPQTPRLSGTSDTAGMVRNYLICTYRIPREARIFQLRLGAGEIRYSTSGGSGGGLEFLVYRGKPKAQDFTWTDRGAPQFSKAYYKIPADEVVTIEPKDYKIEFDEPTDRVTLAIALIDAWRAVKVDARIDEVSLRALE
jgi:hypothetical protein